MALKNEEWNQKIEKLERRVETLEKEKKELAEENRKLKEKEKDNEGTSEELMEGVGILMIGANTRRRVKRMQGK